MTYFRHSTRHIQRAVELRVRDILADAGWLDAGTMPFPGTPTVDLVLSRLRESDVRKMSDRNVVSVSFGQETEDEEIQLGAGLSRVIHAVWIDVVAVSDAICTALASDIKDSLSGRIDPSGRYLPIKDYSDDADGVVVEGWTGSFESVMRDRPESLDWRPNWHVLICNLEVDFGG